ncbi:MAG: HAD hydrolase-like protein [Bacteroidota bacterium]
MLILDLDDTIFQTNSMNPKIFDPAFSVIKAHYYSTQADTNAEQMILEMWEKPLDVVFAKYNTPEAVIAEFYKKVGNVDFRELEIKTFQDYKVIESLPQRKILVTTGLEELQWAKISALGIESDFESIKIDDPRSNPRRYKIDIFRQILQETGMLAEDIWVIGDNPESEIKAGNQLGMNTIQRKSKSKNISELADYVVDSFNEVIDILH